MKLGIFVVAPLRLESLASFPAKKILDDHEPLKSSMEAFGFPKVDK